MNLPPTQFPVKSNNPTERLLVLVKVFVRPIITVLEITLNRVTFPLGFECPTQTDNHSAQKGTCFHNSIPEHVQQNTDMTNHGGQM